MKNRQEFGFTLAEVLITLAIIGVVAAITIPSVIVNTNQMEFKTGLRKAVSVLNQAITLNKALTGESPYDNDDLYNYLQQNMSVMNGRVYIYIRNTFDNFAFYTADGMRFEVPQNMLDAAYNSSTRFNFPLYESGKSILVLRNIHHPTTTLGNCGSLGLAHNPDNTTLPPCIVTVDVNGDRKPNPLNMTSGTGGVSFSSDEYKYADPNGRLLTDIFSIMITDQGAIPYGVVAQKAMYQAQK